MDFFSAFREIYRKYKEKLIDDLIGEDYFKDSDFEKYERLREYRNEDMTFEELVASHIDDRFSDWDAEFYSVADYENGKLKVYRCIAVDDPEEFSFMLANGEIDPEYQGIGVYWAWSEAKAQCHWGKGGKYVTVHGLVPLDAIDKYGTVLMNLNPTLGEDEAEIRLKDGAKVEITGVEIDNELIQNDSEPLYVAADFVRYPMVAKLLKAI